MKKSVIAPIFAAALLAVASLLAPPAQARMFVGNYDVLTNRYDRASWVWFISNCQPPDDNCLNISAIPRLMSGAQKTASHPFTTWDRVPTCE